MSDILFSSLHAEFGVSAEAAKGDRKTAAAIYDGLFEQQRWVLDDKSRRKAVLCPRRAGKSWTALSYSYFQCLTKPWSNCIIVGLTLKSLKGIYWERVIPLFEQQFGIQTQKHHTEMKIRFPNGSLLTFAGCETRAEIEKLRGQAYDLAIIDECKSFSPMILEELVQDVFRRGLADRRGTIMLIGTPGSILEGPFYEGTYPGALDKKGILFSRTYSTPESYWTENPRNRSWRWSRHFWSARDNVALPHLWEEALLDKEMENWADDHPTWLREYLGEWVSSDDVFVYAYAGLVNREPSRVQWVPERSRENKSGLPSDADYRYIIGIDLGFEDDFALVVGAYSLNDGNLYHVYDLKMKHQDVHQVANHVIETVAMFNHKVDAIVADNAGLGKMVIETLNRWHGLNIQAAEKREKYDFIELMNADFHSGKIRVIDGSDLDMELRTLQWDLSKHTRSELVRAGKLREHPGLPNHLCDAWLYIWRYSHHTFGTPAVKKAAPGSPEYFAEWERQSIERMFTERDRQDRMEYAGLNYNDPLQGFYGDRYKS